MKQAGKSILIGVLALGGAVIVAEANATCIYSGDVVVRPGEICRISARRHNLKSLTIESEGLLQVRSRQRQWLILNVEGDVRIDGRISYTQMRAINGPVDAVAPDGTQLSFEHPQQAYGGYGGRALNCKSQPGGAGAAGTTEYGGGGGGGATATKLPPAAPGDNASQWRGGNRYIRGGDGGRRRDTGNGGLVYIFAGGQLSSDGGVIDVSGSTGANGHQGANGRKARTCSQSPAGGGGGGPGGDGGYVMISAAEILTEPDVAANAGPGGRGGDGGQYMGNNPHVRAEKGQDGGWGDAGYADMIER